MLGFPRIRETNAQRLSGKRFRPVLASPFAFRHLRGFLHFRPAPRAVIRAGGVSGAQMTCVGGMTSSSLMRLERYWLRSERSSSFWRWRPMASCRVLARPSSRRLYCCSSLSSRFQMRCPFSPTTRAMRSQYSLSFSARRRSSSRCVAVASRSAFPPWLERARCSASTKARSRTTTSLGCTSCTLTPSRAPCVSAAASASKVVPSTTPSAFRMFSTFIIFPSSFVTVSSTRCTLASTRKPASSQRRSASFLKRESRRRSASWAAAASSSLSSPSPSSGFSVSFAAHGLANSSSEGAFHLMPSCCAWITLSACSTLRTRSATTCSFISHTSL
mmetsp:Transcript_13305/g.28250  ORF Transcript_13305/g.28250 Transcript_13305/m.28250 type:complete len:331 (+) Transcript_13305:224-1216(+)